MLTIPKINHRIWFGSMLPERYQANLKKLASDNPAYITKLWTDYACLTAEEITRLEAFCRESGIILCNIREFQHLANFTLIDFELIAAMKSDPDFKTVHYVRASDLARVSILIAEGGIYTDTDTLSLNALPGGTSFEEPGIEAAEGLLIKQLHDLEGNSDQADIIHFYYIKRTYVVNLLYDFIASQPNHPILLKAAQVSERDYETYQRSSHHAWEKIKDFHIQQWGTIRLTGTAIKQALNHTLQTEAWPKNRATALLFDDRNYLHSTYDKSWLTQFHSKSETDSERICLDLNAFLDEIDLARQRYFPTRSLSDLNRSNQHAEFMKFNFPHTNRLATPAVPDDLSAILKRSQDLNLPELPEVPVTLPKFHFTLPEIRLDDIKIDFTYKLPDTKITPLLDNGVGFFATPINTDEIVKEVRQKLEEQKPKDTRRCTIQ